MAADDRLIYDIGMHLGEDSAYYLHRGYRVVAVEACTQFCEEAAKKFSAELAEGRLTILNVAIAPEAGQGCLWVNETTPVMSCLGAAQGVPAGWHAQPVQCVRYRDILQKHGLPHYAKIDIEGHELDCLNDLTPLTAPAYLSVPAETRYLVALYQLGYRRFKCFNTEDCPSLTTVPGWRFDAGTSGPFGEDTPGEWRSFEETMYDWLLYQKGYYKPCSWRARLFERAVTTRIFRQPARSSLVAGAYDIHAAK